MVATALAERNGTHAAAVFENVVVNGDLSKLQAADRVLYYRNVCDSLGLNPLTKPFDYITLNGKLTLYARKDCAEQLRKRDQISVTIVGEPQVIDDVYVVRSRAQTPNGRVDESIGAVSILGLKGEAKANAMMKSETKSKRRVTLSICGLGILDETEIETVPTAKTIKVNHDTGEIEQAEEHNPPQQSPAHSETKLPTVAEWISWIPNATTLQQIDKAPQLYRWRKDLPDGDHRKLTATDVEAIDAAVLKRKGELLAAQPPANGHGQTRDEIIARYKDTLDGMSEEQLGTDFAPFVDEIAADCKHMSPAMRQSVIETVQFNWFGHRIEAVDNEDHLAAVKQQIDAAAMIPDNKARLFKALDEAAKRVSVF